MTSKQEPVTQALLSRAHSPSSAARIFNDKIQHRPLLLRPSSPPPSVSARAARRKAREQKAKDRKKALKPKPISTRQRRKLGLYELPREGQKYAIFEPLHALWLGYIREVLGNEVYTGGQGAAAKLTSADFHGAEVEVVRSGCVGRVGIRGIVVKDAKFVFEIITRKNKLKTVPKEGTVFRVEIPVDDTAKRTEDEAGNDGSNENVAVHDVKEKKFVFEIHGNQFTYRSADRANKKFKGHFLKEL